VLNQGIYKWDNGDATSQQIDLALIQQKMMLL
jgi:hypothetical protein